MLHRIIVHVPILFFFAARDLRKKSTLEYYGFGNKVLSTSIQGVLLKRRECTILEDIRMSDDLPKNQQSEAIENAVTVLQKLQALKSKVAELRVQCEELRKQRFEEHGIEPLCSKCGGYVESGQEVAIKGSNGTVRAYYHQECFKHILQ